MPLTIQDFRNQIGNLNAGQVVVKNDNTVGKVNNGFWARHFDCFKSEPDQETNMKTRQELYKAIAADLKNDRSVSDGARAQFLADVANHLGLEFEVGDGVFISTSDEKLDRSDLKNCLDALAMLKSSFEKEVEANAVKELRNLLGKYDSKNDGSCYKAEDYTDEQILEIFHNNPMNFFERTPSEIEVVGFPGKNGERTTYKAQLFVAQGDVRDFNGDKIPEGCSYISAQLRVKFGEDFQRYEHNVRVPSNDLTFVDEVLNDFAKGKAIADCVMKMRRGDYSNNLDENENPVEMRDAQNDADIGFFKEYMQEYTGRLYDAFTACKIDPDKIVTNANRDLHDRCSKVENVLHDRELKGTFLQAFENQASNIAGKTIHLGEKEFQRLLARFEKSAIVYLISTPECKELQEGDSESRKTFAAFCGDVFARLMQKADIESLAS